MCKMSIIFSLESCYFCGVMPCFTGNLNLSLLHYIPSISLLWFEPFFSCTCFLENVNLIKTHARVLESYLHNFLWGVGCLLSLLKGWCGCFWDINRRLFLENSASLHVGAFGMRNWGSFWLFSYVFIWCDSTYLGAFLILIFFSVKGPFS